MGAAVTVRRSSVEESGWRGAAVGTLRLGESPARAAVGRVGGFAAPRLSDGRRRSPGTPREQGGSGGGGAEREAPAERPGLRRGREDPHGLPWREAAAACARGLGRPAWVGVAAAEVRRRRRRRRRVLSFRVSTGSRPGGTTLGAAGAGGAAPGAAGGVPSGRGVGKWAWGRRGRPRPRGADACRTPAGDAAAESSRRWLSRPRRRSACEARLQTGMSAFTYQRPFSSSGRNLICGLPHFGQV